MADDAGDEDQRRAPVGTPGRSSDGNISGNIGDWTRRLRREPSVVQTQPGMRTAVHPLDANATESAVGFAGQDDGWDGPKPIRIAWLRALLTCLPRNNTGRARERERTLRSNA